MVFYKNTKIRIFCPYFTHILGYIRDKVIAEARAAEARAAEAKRPLGF